MGNDAPLVWYKLDDAGPTTAANSGVSCSPYCASFDGTATAGVSFGQRGIIEANGAASFNGSAQVTIPAPAGVAAPSSFTVEGWFDVAPSFTATGYVGTLLGTTSGVGVSGGHVFATINESSGSAVTVTSGGSYNDSRWHHLVVTDSNGSLTLYVDGGAVGAATATALAFSGAQPGAIGSNGTSFLTGSIEDVAGYTTALSASQVHTHYLAGIGAPLDVAPIGSVTPAGLAGGADPAVANRADCRCADPVDTATGAMSEVPG